MNLIWEMSYSASRRKHHHRCKYCSCIVENGESVYMGRVGAGKTHVVHEGCADKQSGELTAVQWLIITALRYAEGRLYDYKGRYVRT
jgi:hypothetical protein